MRNLISARIYVYSDSWLSDFFKNKMTDEQGRLFCENWILNCKDKGITSAWICIDGSNDDCDAENMFEAEQGHDKSGNGGPIVSYMWAVSTTDGTPITYRPYRGSRVDSVELKEMVKILSEYGITTEGVILDRGFWTVDDVQCLIEAGLEFIIIMKGGHGFQQMVDLHGYELRNQNVNLMLKKSGSYGIVDRVEAFKNSGIELNAALLYSNLKAAKSINKLTDKVKEKVEEARKKIKNGEDYSIDANLSKYIIVKKYRGRKKDTIDIDYEKLQEVVDGMGFTCLAMSKNLTAQEVDDIYALRQYSEKQYAAFKTQLGYDILRVYKPDSWHSKFACGFIAGIMRNEFENRCKSAAVDTNSVLKELNFVSMIRIKDSFYMYVHLMSKDAKSVMAAHGLIEQDMNLIVEAENARLNGELLYPIHQLPKRDTVKRGPGRPKGSKNKKPKSKPSKPKRKPGRPKGSKNKPTAV